jgi:hypothetical protein
LFLQFHLLMWLFLQFHLLVMFVSSVSPADVTFFSFTCWCDYFFSFTCWCDCFFSFTTDVCFFSFTCLCVCYFSFTCWWLFVSSVSHHKLRGILLRRWLVQRHS